LKSHDFQLVIILYVIYSDEIHLDVYILVIKILQSFKTFNRLFRDSHADPLSCLRRYRYAEHRSQHTNTYYFLRKHEYVLFAAKFISGDREILPYIVVLVRMSVTVEAQLHKHLITIKNIQENLPSLS
jgi:hypothetical protein